MKKALLLACVIIIWIGSGVAIGDELDDKLSQKTPQPLIQSTRQMIQAGVASKEAVALTRAMQQNQLELEAALRAQQIITQAQKRGQGVAALMNKAYEGMTKRVPGEMIVKAMETVSQRQSYAHQKAVELAGAKNRRYEMSNAIEDGLTAGMQQSDMEQTIAQLRKGAQGNLEEDERALETFKTLRDMTRLGVNSKNATEVVGLALGKNYSAEQMRQLRHEFATQTRNGDAAGWANRFANAFRHGQDLEEVTGSGQGNGPNGSGADNDSGRSGNSNGPGGSGNSGGGGKSGGSGNSGGGGRGGRN